MGEHMTGEKKVALVTGASRGIGRAIALRLASDGYHVIVNYQGSEDRAQGVVNDIIALGGCARIYQCNVSDYQQCQLMIDDIYKEYRHLDVLVNNAGITKDGLLMMMKEDDFDDVVSINLKGTFNTMKHSSRYMIKQRSGKIINISSVSGILGNAGQANYAASKAGVIGMTKSVARELSSRNIQVNVVAPGFIDTDMTKTMGEDVCKQVCAMIPMGHMGKPEDIAGMVSFLASCESNYITGQVFCVDGGMAI